VDTEFRRTNILVGLQESWIPVPFAPALDPAALEGRSLTHLMRERHGLIAHHSEFEIQAVGVDAKFARLLEIQPERRPSKRRP
jgi:DNA-binding GntR family transcriptional regulator